MKSLAASSKEGVEGGTLQRAIRVGAVMFAHEGFEATTTRQLSRGLGITNGTFYHHFASKEGLLERICEESLTRITNASSAAARDEPDAEAKLRALMRAHVETMLGDQDLHKTMLMEIRALNGANRTKVLRMRNVYQAVVRQVIELGQKAGVLRGDIGPELMTLMLLNLMNWTILWFRQGGGLTPTELAAVIEETFIEGVRRR